MKKLLMLALVVGLAACENDDVPTPGNGVIDPDQTVDCANAPKTDRRCYYDDGTAK